MGTVLYLGTDEGVVTLRRNGGRSWDLEQGLKGWAVEEVAVVPGSPNKLLAGTRGDGVWLTEDFGKTWKKPCYGKRGPGKVRCLTFDPTNSERVYAGCEPIDVFVSDDLGSNWQRLDSVWDVPQVSITDYPVATVEPHVRDITIDPNDPKVIYAALQVGSMIKSTDAGKTWSLIESERGFDSDVHTILLSPANSETVLIATGGHDYRKGASGGRALFRSSDAGQSWKPMGLEFSQEYSIPLVVHPSRPNVLYSALANGQPNLWRRPTGAESVVIRSEDGGETWNQLDLGLADASRYFPAAITFDQSNPDCVYAALSSGELIATENGGDSWAKLELKLPSVSDLKCVEA